MTCVALQGWTCRALGDAVVPTSALTTGRLPVEEPVCPLRPLTPNVNIHPCLCSLPLITCQPQPPNRRIEWVDFQSCCSINKKYTKPFLKTKCSPQMSYLNCECLNDILLLLDFNNIMHAVSSRKSLLPCSDLRPRQALLEKVHPL